MLDRRRSLAAVVALGATLAIARPASAAPGEAQQRFEEGRALLKEGHPAEAIPKFVASIASEPTVAALLNLADCYEKVGKLASAHARFRQAQELARDKDTVRSEEARKRAEILEPRLSTITLLPPPQTAGVRVWVDGVEVRAAEWGKPHPYDAGPHEVIAQDQSGARRRSALTVEGEAARLTAPIEIAAAPPVVVGPPPPTTPPRDESPSALRTTGLVVGGLGVAALVTGTVTGIVALGASSDLKDACATYPQCPADRRAELTDLDDKARTFATVSTITIVAGAVLVATGAVLFFVSPPSRTQGRAGSRWASAGSLTAW
jgi:hypothetical protein